MALKQSHGKAAFGQGVCGGYARNAAADDRNFFHVLILEIPKVNLHTVVVRSNWTRTIDKPTTMSLKIFIYHEAANEKQIILTHLGFGYC